MMIRLVVASAGIFLIAGISDCCKKPSVADTASPVATAFNGQGAAQEASDVPDDSGQSTAKADSGAAVAATSPVAEWNVLIYMNAKNNLESVSVQNLHAIATAGSTKDVNVIVLYGKYSWEPHHVYQLRITKGMPDPDPTKPPAESTNVKDEGDLDMGALETLREFLRRVHEQFPAKNTLLDIWDHGQGWRLEDMSLLAALPKGRQSKIRAMRAARKGTPMSNYRSVSYDEWTGHHLFNSDVESSLNDFPVDIVGFDACLMGMIETGYAVRRGGRILVASEELVPNAGWNYEVVLGELTSHPEMTPAAVAHAVGESYSQLYMGDGAKLQDETTTMAVVDLTKVNSVANAISIFAIQLTRAIATNDGLAVIGAARGDCREYAPSYLAPDGKPEFQDVDVDLFAKGIVDRSSDDALVGAARAVRGTVAKYVVDKWVGADRHGRYGSAGLAIYFPNSGAVYARDRKSPEVGNGYEKNNADHPVDFVRNEKWSDFLHSYFTRVP